MGESEGPIDLVEASQALLDEARRGDTGRAARTLTPGAGASLKQTLLALTAGNSLQEHVAPGSATIQILIGVARLTAQGSSTVLSAGEWATIPDTSHALDAVEDVAALLTVASA